MACCCVIHGAGTSIFLSPLPDIPENGSLGRARPSTLRVVVPSKDLDLDGLSLDKAQTSGPSATTMGARVSSLSVIDGGKGRRRQTRQFSTHGGLDLSGCFHKQGGNFVRRLYQFAVEVWAAPSTTVFARTKVKAKTNGMRVQA